VVYRDVTRQAKGLYRLKHVGALGSGLAYLSRYNSGWFCHRTGQYGHYSRGLHLSLLGRKETEEPTGPSNVQPPRYRLVQNTATRAPFRNNLPGRWVARPPQQARFNWPPTPQPQQQQQQSPRPSFPPSNQGNNNNRCFNCGSPSHFIKDCPQPRKSFQGQTSNPNNKGKSKNRWYKSDRGG
jgi:hypothetical protein